MNLEILSTANLEALYRRVDSEKKRGEIAAELASRGNTPPELRPSKQPSLFDWKDGRK